MVDAVPVFACCAPSRWLRWFPQMRSLLRRAGCDALDPLAVLASGLTAGSPSPHRPRTTVPGAGHVLRARRRAIDPPAPSPRSPGRWRQRDDLKKDAPYSDAPAARTICCSPRDGRIVVTIEAVMPLISRLAVRTGCRVAHLENSPSCSCAAGCWRPARKSRSPRCGEQRMVCTSSRPAAWRCCCAQQASGSGQSRCAADRLVEAMPGQQLAALELAIRGWFSPTPAPADRQDHLTCQQDVRLPGHHFPPHQL